VNWLIDLFTHAVGGNWLLRWLPIEGERFADGPVAPR
jgi:hypothetical protein